MTNPWLNIPALDYEGPMGLPNVSQTSFLAQIFKDSISKYDSSSFAYLGCATGTGLEYIDAQSTNRLTAIDINPEYLNILRIRYQSKIPCLEIMEADLNEYNESKAKYSLIFAALIFEYLTPKPLLQKITNWLEDTGVMVVVLQLHEQNTKKVSDTPYSSLESLASFMNLLSEEDFKLMANESGMREIEGKQIILDSGKSFYIGAYERIL
ncbi:MAG: class I SAM-dependent methyltransferase [Sulfurimonas sp.]|jgi:trans-aconitate methyltransferase